MISATISRCVLPRRHAVHAQPLGDDLLAGHARRQAAERVLKHDLHVLAQRRAASRVDQPRTSCPSKVIPPSEAISRMIASASVVLPDPLSPTIPRVSPARTLSVASLTAFTWPTVRFRNPRWIGNQTLR